MPSIAELPTRAPKELDKLRVKDETAQLQELIAERQKILFAQKKYSLLIILQGLDASGKDGLISHVFRGLNPLGVSVKSFRIPTEEEAAHDFLWRAHPYTPARGHIAIFNRSYYEEALFHAVKGDMSKKQLGQLMQDINHFEQLLRHNDTIILKFFLHVSREEQLERLKERKTNPEKFWKHNDEDWKTRRKWKNYMDAYELIFRHCNDPEWEIVPADQNWYKESIVAKKLLKTLEELPLKYPELNS